MQKFKIGDKVRITGNQNCIFTITEVIANGQFYRLDNNEVEFIRLKEPNYENFYFVGDLIMAR